MKRLLIILCPVALLALAMFSLFSPARAQQQAPLQHSQLHYSRVCATIPGVVHCNALLVDSIKPSATQPMGLNPADLQGAYSLPSKTMGAGQTVAIVDAYDDPKAEADLGVYRAKFGLPACTTANGCFHKVNQNGGPKPPKADSGWAQEISLDIQMVSAICPNCHILLVEASAPSIQNLATAVNTAARLGANTISNSYGGSEDAKTAQYATAYNHSGVVITASAGDSGYGVQMPAAYNTVVAVGGTSLNRSTTARGWSETTWSGTGSGCSAFISKPSWQTDRGCSKRTVGDVSAVADPATGVSVYDSYKGGGGWQVYGGTSVSSPIIASVYALAENANVVNAASSLYSHPGSLFDVTSGSNGVCTVSYLCTARPGYDGPTGLGTPDGLGAF